jgi:hypothetical protein
MEAAVMKLLAFGALTTAASVLAFSPTLADTPRMPERKAGLWRMATTMDEGRGPVMQDLTMCIDADMERMTVAASQAEHGKQCSKYEIARKDDKTVVEMSCQFSGRQVVSKTELSGDFQAAFLVKIESTTSGEQKSQSVSVKRTISQIGTYLGTDCGDLAGGEAKAPDGTRVMAQ